MPFASVLKAVRTYLLMLNMSSVGFEALPRMQWKVLWKYFLHGILFSVLGFVLFFVWVGVTLLLVMVGFIIGLLVGLGLLFLMIGFVNGLLGDYLWNIETEEGIGQMLIHGVVLSIILFLVSLVTFYLPAFIFPGVVTQIASFIISAPIDGAVGKAVASWFGREVTISAEGAEIEETAEELPKKASRFSYTQPPPSEISDGPPVCPLCKTRTQWEAYYTHGPGIRDYRVRCSVCNAEWEREINRRVTAGGLGTSFPFPFSISLDILILREAGNNVWAENCLTKRLLFLTWKQMVGRFCDNCKEPLAAGESACPKCRTRPKLVR